MKDLNYDVVVVGGGVSGSMAGIACARENVKTLIIEQSGCLGGSLTNCGVGPMMTFFAGEKQVIKGLFQEVVDRMIQRGFSLGHVKDSTNYISYNTPFSSEGLKIILDEMAQEANLDVLFHTTFINSVVENNRVVSINVLTKDGIKNIKAKLFIDATGDADLAVSSGVKTQLGREGDNASQPMTMNVKYCNVDSDKLKDYILQQDPEKYERINRDINVIKTVDRLAIIGFSEEFKNAIENKEITFLREAILMFETNRKGEYIVNTTRVTGLNPVDPFDLSKAEMIGRKQCLELDKFLKKYVPGFENALMEFTGPNIGVRGSRQIIGKYIFSKDDILEKRKFEDTIAHCGYPIDIHNPTGNGTKTIDLGKNAYYSIPFSIMRTNEINNLLVTGRCVSATFEAQAAIRVTPPVSAMGQAAGIAAAISVDAGDFSNTNIKLLQEKLIKNGTYLEV